jgi:hypothetical protein
MTMLGRIEHRLDREFRTLRARLGRIPPVRRPIFIAGTVRSGTTILADCLGLHPQVQHIGFELSEHWSRLGVEIACPDTEDAHCPPLAAGDATPERAERLQEGLARLMLVKGRGAGRRLLNKNPHFWNKLEFIRAVFPDAHLVVISRDLRSSVASTKRLWVKVEEGWGRKHYLPPQPDACWDCIPPRSPEELDPARLFPGGDVAYLAEYWLRTYEGIQKSLEGFRSFSIVRHRDFGTDARAVLTQVQAEAGLSSASYALPPIDSTRNDRWRDLLTGDEQQSLQAFIREHQDRIIRLRCADVTL